MAEHRLIERLLRRRERLLEQSEQLLQQRAELLARVDEVDERIAEAVQTKLRQRERARAEKQRLARERERERAREARRRRVVYREHVLALVAAAGRAHFGTRIGRTAILSSDMTRPRACRRVAIYLLAELGLSWSDVSRALNRDRRTIRPASVARLSVDELMILELALSW